MGNVLTNLSNMTEEDIENAGNLLKMSEEQKEAAKTSLRNGAIKDLINDLNEIKEKTRVECDKILENTSVTSTRTYEGECNFRVDDSEGQKILNKYLPRELNQHAIDMLNIFRTTTFKDLRESEDRYPESAFWSSPLNWAFLAHDSDFQLFLRKDGDCDIDKLVADTHHDKQILREVLTYLYSREARV